jgi:hypothetical protein
VWRGGFNDAGRATANHFPILTGTRPEVRPAVPLLVLDVLLRFNITPKHQQKEMLSRPTKGWKKQSPSSFTHLFANAT